ncbi:MAG: 3-isopropylmalate dehydratase large subunit [Allgaiera sp.]|jgi:3-isopropylmalate/(R)-2-methylmalate dehydratase large subunit|nr:3-isopropylmalate dehydratase large subunit [Allgaiera sp.]
MAMTLAEKLIARAAGRTTVRPGEVVTAAVDLAMIHDSGGPRRVEPILKRLGVGLWDRDRVVLISDHYIPGDDPVGAAILRLTRDWAQAHGVTFHDGQGICHVVLPERGHVAPGRFIVGGDSHSPTGGAFGAYMYAAGATEMAGVLATGEIWIRVPETIRLDWQGALPRGVVAKDMILAMCGRLGMDGGRYQAVEYTGPAIRALGMQERMTLSNMAAELGAQAGLIAPDEVTAAYVAAAGGDAGDWADWQGDAGAVVAERHDFDAATLAPQVAAPHSPANASDVGDQAGQALDVVYIGASTGAKYVDLRAAAEILRGHRPAKGVQILVAPASARDQARAEAEGIMAVFEAAGAQILPNACGICAGYGAARLGADIRCLSTTARNFKGRMGDASARVWLASPYTAAASAIEGRIADPRNHLEGA